jgi:hypothetical protein
MFIPKKYSIVNPVEFKEEFAVLTNDDSCQYSSHYVAYLKLTICGETKWCLIDDLKAKYAMLSEAQFKQKFNNPKLRQQVYVSV